MGKNEIKEDELYDFFMESYRKYDGDHKNAKFILAADILRRRNKGESIQYSCSLNHDTWKTVKSDKDIINALTVSPDNIRLDPNTEHEEPVVTRDELKQIGESVRNAKWAKTTPGIFKLRDLTKREREVKLYGFMHFNI